MKLPEQHRLSLSGWSYVVLLLLGSAAFIVGLVTRDAWPLGVGAVLVVLGVFGPNTGPLKKVGIGPLKTEFGERVETASRALEEAASSTNRPEGLERARELLPAVAALRPSRILWVDDHPERNEYEAKMLKAIGASLVQVKATEEALREINNQAFDLVITDLLRGADANAGISLLATLRQDSNTKSVPVIVYTFDRNGRHNKARELGAFAVTNAPGQMLEGVVRALLAQELKESPPMSRKAP